MKKGMIDIDRVKPGMVVSFESNGSFVNKRIVSYQRSIGFDVPACKQTHVAISMGGAVVIEGTYPRSRVGHLFKDYQGRVLTFLDLNNSAFQAGERSKVAMWAATWCNLNYGWPSLLGFYLHSVLPLWGKNVLSNSRTPVCSHLVAFAFRRVGFDVFPGVSSDLVTPAHFYASPLFSRVDVSFR